MYTHYAFFAKKTDGKQAWQFYSQTTRQIYSPYWQPYFKVRWLASGRRTPKHSPSSASCGATYFQLWWLVCCRYNLGARHWRKIDGQKRAVSISYFVAFFCVGAEWFPLIVAKKARYWMQALPYLRPVNRCGLPLPPKARANTPTRGKLVFIILRGGLS